ncbi:hypothetical protein JNUCC1_02636 [Lentibacillus sp. JNUCC-1]|nr:hypothetical protein [Lentibacillus sp. JNUCC-1]
MHLLIECISMLAFGHILVNKSCSIHVHSSFLFPDRCQAKQKSPFLHVNATKRPKHRSSSFKASFAGRGALSIVQVAVKSLSECSRSILITLLSTHIINNLMLFIDFFQMLFCLFHFWSSAKPNSSANSSRSTVHRFEYESASLQYSSNSFSSFTYLTL